MQHREHMDDNVEAGRAYVREYVSYVHFVEGLHGFLEHGPTEHH